MSCNGIGCTHTISFWIQRNLVGLEPNFICAAAVRLYLNKFVYTLCLFLSFQVINRAAHPLGLRLYMSLWSETH